MLYKRKSIIYSCETLYTSVYLALTLQRDKGIDYRIYTDKNLFQHQPTTTSSPSLGRRFARVQSFCYCYFDLRQIL